jgi:diguanylate cyclase (GGDEF)-like protein
MVRRPGRLTAGVANALLAQLPLAVAIVDIDLGLHYWNDAAADLFGLPPLAAVDVPHLTEILASIPHLLPLQRDRIATFVKGEMEASNRGEAESFLRVSLGRERRLGLRVRGIGARRWMLLIDEGRVFGAAGRSQAGHGDAWLDPLTGLSNRRHFNQVLRDMTENASAASNQALLMIDLDRFTPVNDTLGHAIGDALLCLVSQRLSGETRDDDLLARLGGDEFAILTSNGEKAEALGNRVVDILSRPFVVEGQVVNIGASVGISLFPEHGETAEAIMRHADLALYDAKSGGRRTCRVFSPAMAERAQTRRDLETDLRRALPLGEMSLAYQPQLNVRTKTLTGFEALLRWNHPVRGAVPPAVFIPVAEEIGCIAALGEWVLKTACNEAARWPAPLTVAVNVSPRQIENSERLIRAVDTALEVSGLSPSRLELEITESSLLSKADDVLATLHRLRDRGIRIAMDDFGTGYASLGQLRSFPFDKIKIDRSLIAGLPEGADAAAVIRVIAAIGSGLGMATTAEGVETSEQAALVEADGCTDIQGYLISRPVPASAIGDLMRRYSLVEA